VNRGNIDGSPVKEEALAIAGVTKDYRGLRPLRIERLELAVGDHVAILGLDPPAVGVLVDLVTGVTLPDRGDVRIFGRSSASIASGDEWLQLADRFGIVSDRAVLLEALTTIQNLALPFSLDIEPPSDDLRARATVLANEVGLAPEAWDRPVGELDAVDRLRIRVGRAVALDPAVLILEHPTADVPGTTVEALARDIRRVAEGRGAATITLTADQTFATAVAGRVLKAEPSTGKLRPPRRFGIF
jgi:predicted ABC-type transport system involved in lysophospholipase L1 biosynthesis ATPase subunit